MSIPPLPPFVAVGHVAKAHGTRGELYVRSLTDREDETYVPGRTLEVARLQEDLPDSDFPSLEVETVRRYRQGFLVKFQALDTRTEVELLRGRYLLLSTEETELPEEGELFQHQLLGLTVRTREGREVGEVTEIYDLHPTNLLEVKTAEARILIPFSKEIVVSWDLETAVLLIDPPEGLLDL